MYSETQRETSDMTTRTIKTAVQANGVGIDTQDHTSLISGSPLAATPAAVAAGAALTGGAFAGGYAAEEAADK